MRHFFVLQPIAILAKEKGFKEACLAKYDNAGNYYANTLNRSSITGQTAVPLNQQLIDWFEINHNIYIECPNFYKHSKGYKPEYECRVNGKQLSYPEQTTGIGAACGPQIFLFPTKQEAYNKAFEEAFKLI